MSMLNCLLRLQYFAESAALHIQRIRAEILAVFPLNTTHEGFHGAEQMHFAQFFENSLNPSKVSRQRPFPSRYQMSV
jgi:hypothetical protein